MNRLRQRRLESGLTQGELAARARVSRQLVAAVESDRNAPAVDAALRLAAAVGATAEELFGGPVAPGVVGALGDRIGKGAPVRLARVGDQVVAAEVADHGVAGVGWAKADALWEDGRPRLFPGASPAGLAVAGCEPALGIAEQMLAGLGARSVMTISAPTGRALAALREERVQAAVIHGPGRLLPRTDAAIERFHLTRWPVGLAMPRSIRGRLEAVLRAGLPIVQREPSASIQQGFERASAAVGIPGPLSGPRVGGHLEAARLAATLGCPALTTGPAARAFGLRFLAFEEHTVELWVGARWLGDPGAQALLDVLNGAAFTQRVAALGDYELTGCGERLS